MKPLSIPYELRIGVTGHRKLPDPAAVERAVERLLDELRQTLETAAESPRGECGSPRSPAQRIDDWLVRAAKLVWPSLPLTEEWIPPERRTPLRWSVVSPLAKGADRIVARAVLKQSQEEGQPRLKVIMPFPLDDYRRDFDERPDRTEFEELLELDPSPSVLPNDYGLPRPDDSPEQLAERQNARNEGYYRVGQRVVEACEILIVIWNGQPAAGHGGTADIVRYAVAQGRMILWIDSNHPDQQARQIVGPAVGELQPGEGEVEGFVHRPLPRRAKQLSRGFHRLAAYNRDAAFDPRRFEAILKRDRDDLSKTAQQSNLPEAAFAAVIDVLLPEYARADQLAGRYQQLYMRAASWLQRLSSIAVSVVVIQVLLFPEPKFLWMISGEMAAMLLAVALLRISRGEAWHEKWLRDRHLAERLRIVLFTTLAKPGHPANPLRPDEAMPFYQATDDWIVAACERLAAAARDRQTATSELGPLRRFLIDAWIGNQAKYHARNAAAKRNASHAAHRTGLALFCITLAMAALHWLGVGHGGNGHGGEGHEASWLDIGVVITVLAIVLPAWGATVQAINTLLERERIAVRSKQMGKVLNRIAQRAEQAATPAELSAVIQQAGGIMLMENHEWWVSLSFRPPILPA